MEVSDEVSMEQELVALQPTVSPQITFVIFMVTLTLRSVAGCVCTARRQRLTFYGLTLITSLQSIPPLSHVTVKWLQMTNYKNKWGELELPCCTPEHKIGYRALNCTTSINLPLAYDCVQ